MADGDGESIPDIDHGLASLTEETTAAEFLRSKGQHRKVKTINKEKLKAWILQAINQTRAGMANQYDDAEKEELLKKTQEQLEEVMARAAKAEAEVKGREDARSEMAAEIEALQARAADAEHVEDKSEELAAAMATVSKLQEQYHNAHQEAEDLRLDVYELQDQLNTKMALSRSTMEEKDRLKETMQGLMMRASDLTGGVMHLDQDYYAGKHAEESPLSEDADINEQFFHDFEVGAKVIESLSADLLKLREITESQQEEEAKTESVAADTANLLSRDLALLEQLKSGSLSAADVAQPVDGLIEALSGAREEANTLEKEAAEAMGMPQTAGSISALPDADGDPAQVLAGATAVARELAALFAKERNRINAMQMMVDQAETAGEGEIADAQKFYNALLNNIQTQAGDMGVEVGEALADEHAELSARNAAAAQAVLELAQKAGDTSLAEEFDALLADIAEEAQAAEIEVDASVSDGDAEPRQRHLAARQALSTMVQKASDTSLREEYDALLADIAEQAQAAELEADETISNADADPKARHVAAQKTLIALTEKAGNSEAQQRYDALLERLASEAKESEVDVPESMTNAAAEPEQRQAAAERTLESLSSNIKNISALQQQLDEALEDVPIRETAEEEERQAEAPAAPAHDAVKGLMADRIALLLAQHAALQKNKDELASDKAALEERVRELDQALSEAQAAAGQLDHEKVLAKTVMKAVQGDEELAGDDAVLDLALAIDDYNDEIATDEDDKNLVEQSSRVIHVLGERKHALMTELAQIKAGQLDRESKVADMERQMAEALQERDEMAESGKEIISQVKQQRDAKVQELDEVKADLKMKDNKLWDLETTVFNFADKLSDLVNDEEGQSDEVAAAKSRARESLDQMPGEKSVPLQNSVAKAVTESGLVLIDALARDGGARAKDLESQLSAAQQEAQDANAAKDRAVADAEARAGELQSELDKLRQRVTTLEEAEAAQRAVAQRLADLAGTADDSVEDLQADLAVTLSEVPEEGQAEGQEAAVRPHLHKDLGDQSVAIVDAMKNRLRERAEALQKAEAERDELKGLLRDSRAAIEEYRARNEESSSSTGNEVKELQGKLDQAEKEHEARARELQQQIDDYRLEENVLNKKVEELNRQVEARDAQILEIRKDADSGADRQVELGTLEAQNKALEDELKEARTRLVAYESAKSAIGGREEFSAAGLKAELQRVREEREELVTRIRTVEDELATEKSRVESLKEDRHNLREEFEQDIKRIENNLSREKTAHSEDLDQLKKLRSDLAGAQARIRALSENND